MAPKSQDDQQDDGASRRPSASTPDESDTAPSQGSEGNVADFGAFVSRSVRSSADRLKTGGEDSTVIRARPERTDPAPRRAPSQRRERPSRYWRDSLREKTGEDVAVTGPSSRRFLAPEEETPERYEGSGDGGDDGGNGSWWQRFGGSGGGEGPRRSLLGFFLVGLLAMLLLIFLLTRIFGGDDPQQGDGPTETPAPTEVIAPGGDGESTPESEAEPTQPATGAPTDTPEIRRGGDNQLGGEEQPASSPAATAEEDGDAARAESPLARECPEQCLVRVASKDINKVLEKTGNRPSFSGDGVAWVVATPDQISKLDVDADLNLVQATNETLYLYVVTVPQGEDGEIVKNYGKILDQAGAYRLVEFEEVPASVTTLANSGYNITKVAPAPPLQPVGQSARSPLSSVDGGTLMGQVSQERITEIISTLQQAGAPDGSNLGTRYYSYPGNQIAADYLYRELESYGLRVWYEDFLTPEGILLVNVVAEAPGTDGSAVYAIMSHFDSINTTDPSIAPGADDNSSGMALSLEIARILSGYELKQSVRFVFVNAEEVGIIGASVWAQTANANNVPIEGVFNVDSVGSGRQGPYMVLNSDAQSQWMQDLLMNTNAAYGLGQEILSRQNPIIVADDNKVRDEGLEAVLIARELYGWTAIHHSSDDVIENVSMDNVLSMTYLVLLSIVQLVQ